jgi:hypothetical protein
MLFYLTGPSVRGDLTMKTLYFTILMAVITFSAPGIAAPALTAVGHADYVNGSTSVIRDGESIALRPGEPVYSSDKIVTGDSGRVKLSMNDGSTVYLASKSRISIDHYTVKNGSRVSGLFNTLWGKVRFVVAKVQSINASFSVQTKTATIGVKGTDFTVIEPQGAGPTQVMLHSGKIVADAKRGGSHLMKPGTLARITTDGRINIRRITPQDINILGVPVKAFKGTAGATSGTRVGSGAVPGMVAAGTEMKPPGAPNITPAPGIGRVGPSKHPVIIPPKRPVITPPAGPPITPPAGPPITPPAGPPP